MNRTTLSLFLLLLASPAAAADPATPPAEAAPPTPSTDAAPAQPPPSDAEAPAPQQPPPPQAQAQPRPPASPQPPAPAPPPGQWVYTEQYGWVWMPYAPTYTYVPYDGAAYMYVYGPAFGWSWVIAPWIWGLGPEPWFGLRGGFAFGWWGHGWGPGWHGPRPIYPFRPGPGFRPFRPGPGFRPMHPARPGFGLRSPPAPGRGWHR